MKTKKSFTLIEVLVVIAILAGLVAILFPNFMDARQRARDAQRKADLKTLQKALEYYKEDQSPARYPEFGDFPLPCSTWAGSSSTYLGKVPGDPSGYCPGNPKKYYYYLFPSDKLRYNLYACLENLSDPEGTTCPDAPPFFSTQTDYECPDNWCYKVTEP